MSTTPLDYVHPGHLGAVFVSEESSFCTTGTEARVFPIADTCEGVPMQDNTDVKELNATPYDVENPVQGNKSGTVKMSCYLTPPTTVLAAGATPDDDTAAPIRPLLRCIFGGESVAAGGACSGAAASGSALTLGATQGAHFPAGQLGACSTNNTVGYELFQVRSRAVEDITVYPTLSATPADTRPLINLMTYYPTYTNSRSLSVAITGRDATRQWRFSGVLGSLALKFEKNALAVMDLDLQAATWAGPSALSLSNARAEDPMASPVSVRNATMWLQPVATTTRVNTVVDSVAVTLNFGNAYLESLTGTTEGKRGTMRSENLNDTFAHIELVMPDCADVYTWYAAQTQLNWSFLATVDVSATVRRFIAAMAPQCVIDSLPVPAKGDKNQAKVKVTLRAKVNEQCSGSFDVDALARAPFVLGLG